MTDVLKSLVVYWLMDGGEDNFLVPPLEDILNPKLVEPPLERYPYYVNLMGGNLERDQDGNVSIWVPAAIWEPLGSTIWEAGMPSPGLPTVVKKLQAKGIKVVLSILSHAVEGSESDLKLSVGWSTMTAEDNKHLVRKIRQLKEQFNFDGIDIDDEYGPPYTPRGPGTAKNFYETVRAIRSDLPEPFVISNAVYQMSPYGDVDKYLQFPDLGGLMTYCATMGYGNNFNKPLSPKKDFSIIGEVQTFHAAGIPKEKLYVGVQPGPFDSTGNVCPDVKDQGFTSIEVAKQVADWTKKTTTLA
jgi:hypothetical protein